MGLYDRDYYRESSPGWWGRASGYRATIALIVITVAVFLAQLVTTNPKTREDPIQTNGALYAPAVFEGEVWRVVTANFVTLGQSLFAIIFGMLVLYWAGSEMENIYGPTRFLIFYLAIGVAISLAKLATAKFGYDVEARTGGAAAPVLAVLVLYACHYPHHTIMLMFIIPVPVWILTSLTAALYLLSLAGGGIPQSIVGTLCGVALALLYYRSGGALFSWFDRLLQFRLGKRKRLRLYEQSPPRDRARESPRRDNGGRGVEPEPVGAASSSGRGNASPQDAGNRGAADEYLEAKLDQVLEKMARHGAHSLTAEENEILHRASEIYKHRRG